MAALYALLVRVRSLISFHATFSLGDDCTLRMVYARAELCRRRALAPCSPRSRTAAVTRARELRREVVIGAALRSDLYTAALPLFGALLLADATGCGTSVAGAAGLAGAAVGAACVRCQFGMFFSILGSWLA